MRKALVCAACTALLALSFGPVAGAEAPVREFVPASDFTISGSCAFDVALHIVGNKEYGITFSNGATLVTGSLKVTLTNVSDPTKSITLNIPGPGLNTVSGDGTFTLDARGPWLFFYPASSRTRSDTTRSPSLRVAKSRWSNAAEQAATSVASWRRPRNERATRRFKRRPLTATEHRGRDLARTSRTGAGCFGSRRSSSPACCSPSIEDRRRPLLLRGVRGTAVRPCACSSSSSRSFL